MDVKTQVGLRIRTLRRARKLSQEQLAEGIGRSVDAVSNLERGLSLPAFDTLERLSTFLRVPLSDFFLGLEPALNTSAKRIELESRLMALVRDLNDEALEIVVQQAEGLRRLSAGSS